MAAARDPTPCSPRGRYAGIFGARLRSLSFSPAGTLFHRRVTAGDESKMNRRRKSRRPRAISTENFSRRGEFTLAYLMAPLHHQSGGGGSVLLATKLRAVPVGFNVNDAQSRSKYTRSRSPNALARVTPNVQCVSRTYLRCAPIARNHRRKIDPNRFIRPSRRPELTFHLAYL